VIDWAGLNQNCSVLTRVFPPRPRPAEQLSPNTTTRPIIRISRMCNDNTRRSSKVLRMLPNRSCATPVDRVGYR
jgi:hypothetical protein